MIEAPPRRRPGRFAVVGVLSALILSSCAEDPMGPENRFALIAFGQCGYDQALMLVDQAVTKGNADNVERGLMLKAAILRDRGDLAASEALYPEIGAAWQAAKEKTLSDSRRERDIQMLIDVAHAERHAKGLDPSCQAKPDRDPAAD